MSYPLDSDELLDRVQLIKRWLRRWAVSIGLLALTATTATHTFGGYDCANDCAPLAAGYSWAVEHQIRSLTDCQIIQSDDMRNGCMTYIADPFRGSTQDDQSFDIDQ